ncbi:hypothetical protein HA402_004571 [Bradysia odoriphaga]|nr:hypothetical protein HA402_004571 [Bradysia odoriphaga]
MKGFGTDEAFITEIIGRRSIEQRLEIAKSFKTAYGKDLIDELKSELSGKFEDTIVALMTPSLQFYANELHDAVAGMGTDEEAIIEILVALSNSDVRTVSQLYQQTYGNSLEADLKGDTSGQFQRLCVSLVQGNRNENRQVDNGTAVIDAIALFEAGAGQPGSDPDVFNSILVTRSFPQLTQILKEYEKIAEHEIESAINDKFSGWTKAGYSAIIEWSKSKVDFFAERLQKALSGYFINHKTLIRIIVSRSEVDLGDIERGFLNKTGKSLESSIKDATSGDYRDIMLLVASN